MVEREGSGEHIINEMGLVVRRIVKIDNETEMDVIISEQGLKNYVVERAVDLGLLPKDGPKYTEAVDNVNRRLHLMDTDLFAYLTWFSNQEETVSNRDYLKSLALTFGVLKHHLKFINYVFQATCNGDEHVFVDLGLWNSKVKPSRTRMAPPMDFTIAINMIEDKIRCIFYHEAEHVVQCFFQPEIMKKTYIIKRAFFDADPAIRVLAVGAALLLSLFSTDNNQKMLSQVIASMAMMAKFDTNINPVFEYAMQTMNPAENIAYKIDGYEFNKPESGLYLGIRKLDSDPANID